MKKVGLGVIGCSNRIFYLLKGLPGIGETIEIRGLCDPDPSQIERFHQTFGADIPVYDQAEKLVNCSDLSWVAVATWNSLHARFAAMALAAGKDVFCEKPLVTTMSDARELYQVYKKSGRRVMVGFTLRYSNYYQKIKELLTSGAIGKVISFEFNETLGFNHGGHIMSCWRRKEEFTGSHILEKCSHDIDLANWLIDSRVSRVASFGGLNFFIPENQKYMESIPPDKNGRKPFCSWHPDKYHNPFITDKDIIDNQVVILEYDSGARAVFHTNLCAGIPERRFYILGTEGAIRFDLCSGKIEMKKIGFDEELQEIPLGTTDGHGGGDEYLKQHWVKMMLENAPSMTPFETGLDSALVCFAAEDARKNRRIVEMNEFRID